MKKTYLLLIAILMLTACEKSPVGYDSTQVAQLKESNATLQSQVNQLINEKEALQARLDKFDPNVLNQNTVIFTSIPLLMAAQSRCSAINSATHCELQSSDAVLILPIKDIPSFIYVLNPTPNQIYIVYYDEKELSVYGDYSIVSKGEAASIGMAGAIKTFADGRVLMRFDNPSPALTNPTAIDAFNKQFRDQLGSTIDLVFNSKPANG